MTDKKKREAERQERIKGFVEEFKELSKKYQVDLGARLEMKQNGIVPKLVLVDLTVKPDAEPKKS